MKNSIRGDGLEDADMKFQVPNLYHASDVVQVCHASNQPAAIERAKGRGKARTDRLSPTDVILKLKLGETSTSPEAGPTRNSNTHMHK